MNQQRIYYLLEQELEGKLSEAEAEELTAWKLQEDDQEAVAAMAQLMEQQAAHPVSLSPAAEQAAFDRIRSVDAIVYSPADAQAPVRQIPVMRRWAWAAAILVLLAAGTYLWQQQSHSPSSVAHNTPADILPGKDGAVLTLADGSKVVLDSLGEGVVATQNGSQVMLKNGRLVYAATGNAAGAVAYNTMSTPKGRQFTMTLPDGSKIWLNAASSITYPTVFTGKERLVQITGEAYFEIAANAAMPFRVKVNEHTTIDVLGTSFNVNAYTDEASLNTTLLEGAVRINTSDAAKNAVVLKPGQQAQITARANGEAMTVYDNADIGKVMAWKNGLFNFEDASLEEVMRQVGRWYDVEVVYEKGVTDVEFGGKLSRNKTLAAVIQALGDAGVKCELVERKLVVKL